MERFFQLFLMVGEIYSIRFKENGEKKNENEKRMNFLNLFFSFS